MTEEFSFKIPLSSKLCEDTIYPIIVQYIMVFIWTNQILGMANLFLEYITR